MPLVKQMTRSEDQSSSLVSVDLDSIAKNSAIFAKIFESINMKCKFSVFFNRD